MLYPTRTSTGHSTCKDVRNISEYFGLFSYIYDGTVGHVLSYVLSHVMSQEKSHVISQDKSHVKSHSCKSHS